MNNIKNDKVKILFIDIEGGWGGSSRSLYYLIKNLDKNKYSPVVILGKRGPALDFYKELNIESYIFYPIPRISAQATRTLKAIIRFGTQLIFLPKLIKLIRMIIDNKNIKIIHLNHESLFFLGLCIKLFFNVKIIYHVRTMFQKNILSKIEVFIAVITANFLIFITENERDLWHSISKKSIKIPQKVIYNIAGVNDKLLITDINKTLEKFKIISLMTLTYSRGVDRLMDICIYLKKLSINDVVFIVCGRFDDREYENYINNRIHNEGVEEFFLFVGFQKKPESFLSKSDVLIRPSRKYGPWGRDVIEALAMGKPVLAIGTYDKFVEDGVNGYLFPEFDAEEIAKKIIYLKEHSEVRERMRKANIEKARRLFDGPSNARKVMEIYERLLN